MSWAEEDWTVGLSGRVLQKVKELQVQQQHLARENKQKQLQLDNIHTSYEKQTLKYDEVRGELQSLQRELQSIQGEAKAAGISRERLNQDLQTKQAQVCSLEGQLDSARTLNDRLTKEVKRLESELEKLQNSCRSADTSLFSTPCWTTASSWEKSGSRKEDRSGQQDGPGLALHIRQRLQFSDMDATSSSRQQYKSTPQSEFSTPLAVFPWERDDPRPVRRSPSSPQTPLTNVSSQGQLDGEDFRREKDPRTETEFLSEMWSRVSTLEKELSVKDSMLKATQSELVQCKKELAAKELSLQKAHTSVSQENEKTLGVEQKLKQVQEELKCQRQNSESSRLQHQQRIKELEKHHQRDLMEFQKDRQCLEKQHQQEVNKLSQELQQAQAVHNALQAQADKLSLQKQAVDKEVSTLKEKLKWTEGQLQETLKKEAQTQARLTEALREAEGVALNLEQSRKKERVLEEEGKRLAEERADALRLLMELQKRKATPPLQPVQYCPIEQSFSPQPSYSLHSPTSRHTKRPTTATQAGLKGEEDDTADERRVEILPSYSTDREPGEGIDSEHIIGLISPDSESLQKGGHSGKSNEVENKSRNEAIECDSYGTSKHSTFDDIISPSLYSSAGMDTNTSVDDNTRGVMLSTKNTPTIMSKQIKTLEHLKNENAMLHSDLHDLREELQKRLEDLETQRRAEAEARTRLKQLSRKIAAQAVEIEEQDKEWRVQLESERAEIERLRKAMAALQAEIKRTREESEDKRREEREDEKHEVLEDRESEIVELNIQLKKQLAEVTAQLALERKERKTGEEGKYKLANKNTDLNKELSIKVAELKAEFEEVKRGRKEDLIDDHKVSVANSPVTYLTLRDDELNSNIIHCDNMRLPSPEQHLLLCQSTNQRNILVSQATADLTQEDQTVTDTESSTLTCEGQIDCMTSSPRDKRQKLHEGGLDPSDLAAEVDHLQKENAKETERANQYQVKLKALQSQVTRQTQQLTMAFEKQSQHISGLLAELQERDSALLCQGEELQHYKQELDELRAKRKQEERKTTDEIHAKEEDDGAHKGGTQRVEIAGPQPNQEKECVGTLVQPKILASDAETQTSVNSKEENEALSLGEQVSGTAVSDKIQSDHVSVCATGETEWSQYGGTAGVVAELLVLRQENHLLKQRIETLDASDISKSSLQIDSQNQEVPVRLIQNTGNAALSCFMNNISAEGQESLLEHKLRMDDEEKEDNKTTQAKEEQEEMSQLQISHLEQQVVALQMKVQALTKQTQQQADELVVWRLASQPAPTFDKVHPNTDKQSDSQAQISAITEPNQQHTDKQMTNQADTQMLGHHGSPGNVTVIREDGLFLSCSSNKLQGRMLFSRLQHSSLPEPKSLHPFKKMSAPQDYNQESARLDKESEKENKGIVLIEQTNICPTQGEERTDIDLIQMASDNISQQITQDLYKVLGLNKTKPTEIHTGNPEAKQKAPSQTNDIYTTNGSSDIVFNTKMRSVSSQTEGSLFPCSAPAASGLHCASTQTEEEGKDEELIDSPVVSHVPLTETADSGERLLFAGAFPILADPARLAERIRRSRTQLSAAFDDTEYEPYGLPEVVMKGFADIPSGPSCPYIVRRGLLGTTGLPVPQKDPGQEETD
ncbi:centromere protein F isoform X2 [Channa argus]|uniref:centromere protein F isoform X2 n=1 Tax=Channa argus TaxID=215402 RepID=UPI00351F9B42